MWSVSKKKMQLCYLFRPMPKKTRQRQGGPQVIVGTWRPASLSRPVRQQLAQVLRANQVREARSVHYEKETDTLTCMHVCGGIRAHQLILRHVLNPGGPSGVTVVSSDEEDA